MKNKTHQSFRLINLSAGRTQSATLDRSPALFRWTAALALALAAFVFLTPQARGQATPNPPGEISYQGFLTDANGIALATNAPKNYVVTFTIYDAATGGNIKWAENQTVTVDRGYFSVLLGAGTPVNGNEFWTNNLTTIFSGPTASSRFIGLTVAGLPGQSVPAEIQPRLQMLSNPYALLAANANALSDNTGVQVVTTVGTSVGVDETPFANDALSIKGNVGVYQNSSLTLGEGLLGQASGAGQISYEGLSVNALDITGAGTAAAGRRIKLWAETATSTTGPLGIEIDTPAASLDANAGAFIAGGSGLASAGNRKGISLYYDTVNGAGQIQAIQPGTGYLNLGLNVNGGNVGLGTATPGAKLDVNGATYLESGGAVFNKSILEFGHNITKESNAGKIGYQAFDNNLDIVGAGTTGANRAITMFAEGGTGFTGAVTVNGAMTANAVLAGGTTLTAGDVFSLNGTGHYNNNRMYLRSGTDVNHWLGYDNTYGFDGPALVGYSGGCLGHTSGGFVYDLYWTTSGEVVTRSTLFANGPVYGTQFIGYSDKHAKENIEDVDAGTVLSKLVSMPVTKWNYTNAPGVTHLGAMAQDFAASFGYGIVTNDNTRISYGDEIGVSMVAIKGLNQKLEQKDKEKDAQIADLQKQVADLKSMVETLVKSKSNGQ